MLYFTSDVHFGHTNTIRYNKRPFVTREEMDEEIIRRWNEKVRPEDTVYILGDLAITEKVKKYVLRLNGKKILIRGNHDYFAAKQKNETYFEEIKYMDILHFDGHPYTLCHYPMIEWNGSRRAPTDEGYGYLLYGHIHNNVREQYRLMFEMPHAYNVGMDVNGYEPVTLEELRENNRVFRKRGQEILSSLPKGEKGVVVITEMTLADGPFNAMVNGKKSVEVRLNDEKRKALNVGDVLRFRRKSNPTRYVHAQIVSLDRFDTFSEAFASEKILLGAALALTPEESVEEMSKYYTKEREKACGVLCIGIQLY